MTAGTSAVAARSRPRAVHPPLSLVACGACLGLSLITGIGLAGLVGSQVTAAGLNATLSGDRDLVMDLLARDGPTHRLSEPLDEASRASLSASLVALLRTGGIQSATIYDANVRVLASAGNVQSMTDHPRSAGSGLPQVSFDGGIITEDLPVLVDGSPSLFVRLLRDGIDLGVAADTARAAVVLALLVAGGLLSAIMVLAFRTVQRLLNRQTEALVEIVRRDRLTGLPSHGTVVDELTALVAAARRDGGWLVVALLDIDGFDLFNTTFGHEAGDAALQEIARILDDEAPSGAVLGRYGPDEFLVVGPPACADQIRPAIQRIRERLQNVQLAGKAGGHVPLTVSVGVATFPEHAAAVSELLAAATLTLRDAKVSGGDTVRVDAPGEAVSPDELRNFGVLQGLVTAVDTKDHYTKRHSEEVAYYAIALARHLGLDEPFLAAVRQAGLLHDIGKISVPDAILRKPGPLTEAEWKVVREHPVIGDLIVGGLPNMEVVRAGIRHHHERWDGEGYPDRLHGEEIPRMARIVSVADTFSAMTTSRSYRAGLPVAEAIRRLEEAAGSQLDPQFVSAFLELLNEQPEILSPEGDPTPARLWRMSGAVA